MDNTYISRFGHSVTYSPSCLFIVSMAGLVIPTKLPFILKQI